VYKKETTRTREHTFATTSTRSATTKTKRPTSFPFLSQQPKQQFFATCYADGAFVQRFHSKHNGHDGTKVTPWEEVEDDAREKDDDEGEEDESEGELDGRGLEARQQQPGLRRRRRLVQFSVPLRMPDFVVRLAGVDSVSVLESQELTLAKGSRPRRRGGDGGGGSAESVELESMQLDCSPLLDLAVAQRFAIETGGFLRVERREFEGAGASSSSSSPASASGIRITALIRVSSGGPWGLSAAVDAAMASQAKSEAVALLTLAFEALSEAAELGGEGALPPPPGPPRVSDVVVVASGAEEAAVPAASAADVAAEGEGEDGEGEEEVPLAVRETASSSSDDESEFAEEDEGDGLSLDGSAFQDALSQPPPSAADADAMLRMLDCVAARLLSLEREVEAARAIVEASCPDVIVVEKGFAQRLLSSVLPTSSLSWSSSSWWWPTEEREKIRYPRSSGVAVAAAATAVIAAFVAVRGASSSSSSSRSRV
jgi:hypothetical protein